MILVTVEVVDAKMPKHRCCDNSGLVSSRSRTPQPLRKAIRSALFDESPLINKGFAAKLALTSIGRCHKKVTRTAPKRTGSQAPERDGLLVLPCLL